MGGMPQQHQGGGSAAANASQMHAMQLLQQAGVMGGSGGMMMHDRGGGDGMGDYLDYGMPGYGGMGGRASKGMCQVRAVPLSHRGGQSKKDKVISTSS